MNEDLIAHMRDRIARCRRLAKSITDPAVVSLLLEMVEEGEADVRRLEAERDAARPAA